MQLLPQTDLVHLVSTLQLYPALVLAAGAVGDRRDLCDRMVFTRAVRSRLPPETMRERESKTE